MLRLPQISTLFPYTTLFRSVHGERIADIALTEPEQSDIGRTIGSASTIISPKPGLSVRGISFRYRSEEHTSELQSHVNLVCRLLLDKKNAGSRSGGFRKIFR